MKIRRMLLVLLGVLFGGVITWKMPVCIKQAYHERQIQKFIESLENLDNNDLIASIGPYMLWETPKEPMVSLAILTDMGVLKHLDLVIPSVSLKNRKLHEYWRGIIQKHSKLIVYAIANAEHSEFQFKGDAPFHLNIWFRDTDEAKVIINDMVRHIETTWGNHLSNGY